MSPKHSILKNQMSPLGWSSDSNYFFRSDPQKFSVWFQQLGDIGESCKLSHWGIRAKILSICKKIGHKCKQKLCGFTEDKSSNRRKLLIHEFQETLFKVMCKKTKLIHESWFILIMYYDTQGSIVKLLEEGISWF